MTRADAKLYHAPFNGELSIVSARYRQSNGYVPAPLDLACITIPDHLSQLLDTLARDAHNVWAAKRIGEGWSYGHSKV